MAIPTLSYVLLDGATAWSCHVTKVSYIVDRSGGSDTSTRIYLKDHMHQDVDEAPSTVRGDLAGAGLTIQAWTLLDGGTPVYVNEEAISSIEELNGGADTWLHLEGHWVLELAESYASVLAAV